jgi:hypothetical protein
MRVGDGRNQTRSSRLRCGAPSSRQRPLHLKVDVRNAVNTCSRSNFLHVVRVQFPELLTTPPPRTATNRCYSSRTPFSRAAPAFIRATRSDLLFFALALVVILRSIDTDALELNAWYLDDGTVGATTLAIRAFLDSLAQVRSQGARGALTVRRPPQLLRAQLLQNRAGFREGKKTKPERC